MTAPALLIAGQRDTKLVALNEGLAVSIPNATLRLIPDAGHVVQMEQPEAFLAAVTDFLERLHENGR